MVYPPYGPPDTSLQWCVERLLEAEEIDDQLVDALVGEVFGVAQPPPEIHCRMCLRALSNPHQLTAETALDICLQLLSLPASLTQNQGYDHVVPPPELFLLLRTEVVVSFWIQNPLAPLQDILAIIQNTFPDEASQTSDDRHRIQDLELAAQQPGYRRDIEAQLTPLNWMDDAKKFAIQAKRTLPRSLLSIINDDLNAQRYVPGQGNVGGRPVGGHHGATPAGRFQQLSAARPLIGGSGGRMSPAHFQHTAPRHQQQQQYDQGGVSPYLQTVGAGQTLPFMQRATPQAVDEVPQQQQQQRQQQPEEPQAQGKQYVTSAEMTAALAELRAHTEKDVLKDILKDARAAGAGEPITKRVVSRKDFDMLSEDEDDATLGQKLKMPAVAGKAPSPLKRAAEAKTGTETPDTDGGVKKKKPKKSNNPRRRTVRWNKVDTDTLIEGVREFGVGQWAGIKRKYPNNFETRTSVDLKDRWRTLLAAANRNEEMAYLKELNVKHSNGREDGKEEEFEDAEEEEEEDEQTEEIEQQED